MPLYPSLRTVRTSQFIIFICLFLLASLPLYAQSGWFNTGLNYRVQIKVDPAGVERIDKPIEIDVNFTRLLSELDEGGNFNSSSVRLIEIDRAGQILDLKVPFQFDRAADYDAETRAQGKLTLLMRGKSSATRYFQLYFDTNNTIRSAVVPSQITVQDKVEYEGQDSIKIQANNATYFYHKQGAAFASIIDRDGNDWVSYKHDGKNSNDYRGVPNLGDFAHPGFTNSRSTIIARGPVKISILSETQDRKNVVQWDIFPDFARMTLLRAEKPYWFLYEGTPAGKLDLETAYMVNSEGRKIMARQDWQFDLPRPEWIYFGDEKINRVLFFAHHEDDSQYDQFWHLNGNSTVFGFGRQYKCCARYLSQVPAHFTIGFVDDNSHFNASNRISSAFRDVVISLGKPENRFEANGDLNAARPRILSNEILEVAKSETRGPNVNADMFGAKPSYLNKPEHQFYGGYCTWHAAKKFKEFTGNPVTWSGDGGAWFDNAAAEGRKVTTDARQAVPGSVMVWTRGSSATKGHVAFVEEIDENGLYISEMNVRGRWVISTAFIPFNNLDKGTKYKYKGIILPE